MANSSSGGSDPWNNLSIYIVYIVEGAIIGGSNLAIVIAIARYEALRTVKEYLLMLALSLADALHMAAYFCAGIYRIILLFLGRHNSLVSPWSCVLVPHNIFWSFGKHVASFMLVVISCDRLLCVSNPLKYIGWPRAYIQCMVGSVYAFAFLMSGVSFGLVFSLSPVEAAPMIAACYPPQAFANYVGTLYHTYFHQVPTVAAVLSVLLYVCVWLQYIRRKVQVTDGQNASWEVAKQRKFTKSLGLSCICTVCFFIVPYSCGVLSMRYLGASSKITFSFWVLANVNPLCNTVIYPLRHKEVRIALKSLLANKAMPSDIRMWQTNNIKDKAVFHKREA